MLVSCNSYAHRWAKEHGYGSQIENPKLEYGFISTNHQTIDIDEGIEATCMETGLTEGSHCLDCDDVVIRQEIVPAEGHAMTTIAAQAATCTEPGNSAYWQCSSCNKCFSDADGKTEIDKNSWTIPVTAHTLTEHAKVEATCTTAGTEAYWDCSVCKKLFIDKAATTEIETPEVILAMDHDWDTPTYEWTTDNSEVTATRVCKHNPAHIETEKKGTIRELISKRFSKSRADLSQ